MTLDDLAGKQVGLIVKEKKGLNRRLLKYIEGKLTFEEGNGH